MHPSNAHFSIRFLVKNDFKIIRFTVIQIDLLYVNRFFLIQNTAFVDKSSLSKPAIPTILMTFQQGSYKINKYLIYLQLNSIRIAGTIRGFRTFKFAQKDGLLAAFFELFLCQKCTKRIKKYTNFSKNHLNCVAYFVLFFSKKSFCKSNFIPFEVIFNST